MHPGFGERQTYHKFTTYRGAAEPRCRTAEQTPSMITFPSAAAEWGTAAEFGWLLGTKQTNPKNPESSAHWARPTPFSPSATTSSKVLFFVTRKPNFSLIYTGLHNTASQFFTRVPSHTKFNRWEARETGVEARFLLDCLGLPRRSDFGGSQRSMQWSVHKVAAACQQPVYTQRRSTQSVHNIT
jgi:hypothetical protein